MSDFKHITVNAADEDEVIVAGLVEPPENGPGERPARQEQFESEGFAADGADTADAEDGVAGGDAVSREHADRRQSAQAAPEKRQDAGQRSAKAPKRADPYRETTLEDLQSQPMPLAQRVVIIAALICIIGAIVYYFVAMR